MNIILLAIAPFFLLFTLIKALPSAGIKCLPKRLVLFSLVWIALSALNVVHIIGFILDALLFRKARQLPVKAPVFVLGVPRSGTTFLQRVLANDASLTTLRTWECILAPSISERYFWQAVAFLGRPFVGLVERAQQRLFVRMDNIHTIRLDEPEEDFLLFLSIHACFLLFVLAPNSKYIWQLSQFDQQLPAWWRRLVMQYYYSCLQKHLYFHGSDLRILSKNPSFTSMMTSLSQTFPDAKFIACTRDPETVVASQLSSLKPSVALFASMATFKQIQQPLLNSLAAYYEIVAHWASQPNCVLVPMSQIKTELVSTTKAIYQFCHLEVTDAFAEQLEQQAQASRQYSSGHQYSLLEYHIGEDDIRRFFMPAWRQHQALSMQGA
ncbi:sulfotransferase family protein [Salinibius halmophilus]|uniref:sulfotransferase family protein n=1 Tax=Salinibius halmophilus TaxID=1853216 RepID=UPI000E674123|nr:sulfotransferase [Salinibius halmophilus]